MTNCKTKFMKKFLVVLFSLINLNVISQQKSSWQIWVSPLKYTINLKDTMIVAFGLTGYGNLTPSNLKIVAYSEGTTMISFENKLKSSIFIIGKDSSITPKNFFNRRNPNYPLFLETDGSKNFDPIYLIPKESGEKRLLLIATYSPDGTNWYTTSREVSYHVNSWAEQHQGLLIFLGILTSLFALPFIDKLINKLFKTNNSVSTKSRAK